MKAIILGLGIYIGLLSVHETEPTIPIGVVLLSVASASLIAVALA